MHRISFACPWPEGVVLQWKRQQIEWQLSWTFVLPMCCKPSMPPTNVQSSFVVAPPFRTISSIRVVQLPAGHAFEFSRTKVEIPIYQAAVAKGAPSILGHCEQHVGAILQWSLESSMRISVICKLMFVVVKVSLYYLLFCFLRNASDDRRIHFNIFNLKLSKCPNEPETRHCQLYQAKVRVEGKECVVKVSPADEDYEAIGGTSMT